MSKVYDEWLYNSQKICEKIENDINGYINVRKELGYDVSSEEIAVITLLMVGCNVSPELKSKYTCKSDKPEILDWKTDGGEEYIDFDAYLKRRGL